MLSVLMRGLLLLLCGCQMQKPHESIAEVLEAVETLHKNHQTQEAIDYLTTKEIYKNLDLLETLAFLYEENDEKLLAAQTFEQLFHADIDKQYIECAFHAAEIYYQLDDIYSAGRCYRLYLDLNPQDYSIWFKLSDIETQLNHPASALTAYFNGLEAVPLKTDAHIKKLSELCFNNNMLKATEFWGQIALNRQPKDPQMLELLLKVADQHNDRNKVMFYIQKLKDLSPDFLNKHPDLCTKYVCKEAVIDHSEESKDITISHDIHSTSQEIEYTLQQLSPYLLRSIAPNPKINFPIPLCPNSIY